MTESAPPPGADNLPPAGWYPDPEDASRIRFWDGTAWAAPQETVALPGAPAVPPAAAAPAPVASPYAAPPQQVTTPQQPWTTVGYTQMPPPGYPAAYPQAPMQQPVYTPAKPTDGFAVTSLILGVCGFIFPILTGIPAIIFGFVARSRIKKTGNGGAGMALAGIILGFVTSLFAIGVIIFIIALVAAVGGAASSASGGLGSDTLKARADALVVGAGISSCKDNGGLPTDQTSFDNCMNSAAMGDTASDSPISGVTVDYWYRPTSKTFCVQITKGTATGGWDTDANIPTVSRCPETATGLMPTATTVRP